MTVSDALGRHLVTWLVTVNWIENADRKNRKQSYITSGSPTPPRRLAAMNMQGTAMDRHEAADRLRSLASDSTKRSKAAQVRDLFREIEEALAAGVSQATVLQELHAMGLDVKPSTLRSMMRRFRTRQTQPTAGMSMQDASTRTRFADTGGGAGPSTTLRGSLYDVEALSRLLLASAHSRPSEDALHAWRAAPRR